MLKAISDRIIVRLAQKESSLLLHPDKPYTNKGTVLSVGEKVKFVSPGDEIVFHTFDELPLPEEGLAVIRQSSLLGIYADKN